MSENEVQSRLLFHIVGGGLGHLSRNIVLARQIRQYWPRTEVLFTGRTEYGDKIAPELAFLPLRSGNKPRDVNTHDLLPFAGAVPPDFPSTIEPVLRAMIDAMLARFDPGVVIHDTMVWRPLFEAAETKGLRQAIVFRRRKDQYKLAHSPSSPLRRADLLLLPYEPIDAMDILASLPADGPPAICIGEVVRQPSLAPGQLRRQMGLSNDATLIVITAGAGGFPEDPGFYQLALEALDSAINDLRLGDFTVVLVLGPRYEGVIPVAAYANVQVWHAIPWMPDLIAEANLVLCCAGYNTVAEVISARVPAILYPGVRTNDDQWARARQASRDWHSVHVLEQTSPNSLADLIVNCLEGCNGTRQHRDLRSPEITDLRRYGLGRLVCLGRLGECV